MAGPAGAGATANISPVIGAAAGAGATLQADGDISITAMSNNSAVATTYGVAVGAVAIGGSQSTADANGSTTAILMERFGQQQLDDLGDGDR